MLDGLIAFSLAVSREGTSSGSLESSRRSGALRNARIRPEGGNDRPRRGLLAYINPEGHRLDPELAVNGLSALLHLRPNV